MALTRTLAQLRDAVQRTADVMQFTEKHPESYVNDLINRGLGALSRLCRTTNPEFQPIASQDIDFDGTNTLSPLPGDFRSLISVEYVDDNGDKSWLTPYEMHERAALTTPDTVSSATRAYAYKVIGSNIEFLPLPPDGDSATIWYATAVTQLEANEDAVDTMERLDDYVIWWAAREIADERENWARAQRLDGKLASLEADIRILARSIDLSHPARPVALRHSIYSGRRPRR